MFEQFPLGRNRVTSQQVGNIHLLDIIDLNPSAGEIHKSRNTTNMQRKALQKPQDFPATGSVR